MYQNQKDCRPEDTVIRIKDILQKNNILVIEKEWYDNGPNLHSVFLNICGTLYKTEGKGVDIPLTLASGYAELMERLQNARFLPLKQCIYPDARELELNQIISDRDNISKKNMESSVLAFFSLKRKKSNRKFKCVPFYHYNSKKIKYLPYELINWASTSNGMCAGNTPEEALVSGLCECFERFVIQQIFYNDNIDLPVVPSHIVQRQPSFSLIQTVNKMGYKVIVKDCSLSGKFPVVGCLFLNRDMSQYGFHLGSAPIFDTALQRCITEIFQRHGGWEGRGALSGIKVKHMHTEVDMEQPSKVWRALNLSLQRTYGEGCFGVNIFRAAKKSCLDKPFVKKAKSNQHLLKHLLNIINEHKLDLFVRDVSYLGFPAFRIYIPSVTEVNNLEGLEVQHFCSTASYYVPRLKDMSKGEVQNFLNKLEYQLLPQIKLKYDSSKARANQALKAVYACIRFKRYDLAYKFALEYKTIIQNVADEKKMLRLRCFIMIIKMRDSNLKWEEIIKNLKHIYGGGLVKELCEATVAQEKKLATGAAGDDAGYSKSEEFIHKFLKSMIQKVIDQSQLRRVFEC